MEENPGISVLQLSRANLGWVSGQTSLLLSGQAWLGSSSFIGWLLRTEEVGCTAYGLRLFLASKCKWTHLECPILTRGDGSQVTSELKLSQATLIFCPHWRIQFSSILAPAATFYWVFLWVQVSSGSMTWPSFCRWKSLSWTNSCRNL